MPLDQLLGNIEPKTRARGVDLVRAPCTGEFFKQAANPLSLEAPNLLA
jgi:hypothetical protein